MYIFYRLANYWWTSLTRQYVQVTARSKTVVASRHIMFTTSVNDAAVTITHVIVTLAAELTEHNRATVHI